MVQLIDLWVATMLPWEVLDLTFDVIAAAPVGDSILCGPLDGLRFAGGFVDLATRELWWDDPRDDTPHGLRAVAVVANVRAESERQPAPPPRPSVTLASLARLLPHGTAAYPTVEWHVI
jgi:hypothetical protein